MIFLRSCQHFPDISTEDLSAIPSLLLGEKVQAEKGQHHGWISHMGHWSNGQTGGNFFPHPKAASKTTQVITQGTPYNLHKLTHEPGLLSVTRDAQSPHWICPALQSQGQLQGEWERAWTKLNMGQYPYGEQIWLFPQWKLAARLFIAEILRQPGHKNNLCLDAYWMLLTMLFAQPFRAEKEHPVLGW